MSLHARQIRRSPIAAFAAQDLVDIDMILCPEGQKYGYTHMKFRKFVSRARGTVCFFSPNVGQSSLGTVRRDCGSAAVTAAADSGDVSVTCDVERLAMDQFQEFSCVRNGFAFVLVGTPHMSGFSFCFKPPKAGYPENQTQTAHS